MDPERKNPIIVLRDKWNDYLIASNDEVYIFNLDDFYLRPNLDIAFKWYC